VGLGSGYAQTAPSASVSPTAPEQTVRLDPFNVSADSDVGFVAASSLAGGRIATALKDTPVAYSVVHGLSSIERALAGHLAPG
jgi:hypothetical protein